MSSKSPFFSLSFSQVIMNGDDSTYFSSYDDLEVHRLMLLDKPRTESYRQAIVSNAEFFKGKTVLDVGAGTGILSLFSFQAGAKKVYAVEASPMANALQEIVKANKAEEVIEVINKRVEDVELPEKVDVLVSEWMGFYLLHESMLDSVLKARDNHLKEDGVMMPSSARIFACPISCQELRSSTIDYWQDVYGFNMGPLSTEALKRTKPEVDVLDASRLLSDPVELVSLDLTTVTSEELSNISDKKFVSCNKTSKFQGLSLWFDVRFENLNVDGWREVSLNTGPCHPPTHWKQTIVPLFQAEEEGENVEEDEIIGWSISMIRTVDDKNLARNYAIQVEILDPAVDEHPLPCGCKSAKCTLISALLDQDSEDDIELDH